MKQQLRKSNKKIQEEIEAEVKRLKVYSFIREEQHLNWLPNIVLVIKKNEKVRVYIDFINLNDASPKDDFFAPNWCDD